MAAGYAETEGGMVADLVGVTLEEVTTPAAVREARRVWNATRRRHSYVKGGERVRLSPCSSILSPPGATEKMALEGGDGRRVWNLALAAADRSGYEVCPQRGACTAGCVGDAGNGGYGLVQAVRRARTRFVIRHARHFLALLVSELDAAVASDGRIAVRLNAYSDIRWERVLPAWLWERYAGTVAFYDYTKHSPRSRPTVPANYSLVYSHNERTTPRMMREALEAGRNVAVVVDIRGGVDHRTGAKRPIPSEVLGVPAIDGDVHDRRYADPAGVVVVLRRKGTLRADSPFVVKVGEQ